MESILQNSEAARFCTFPIKHNNLWQFYKNHLKTFWTAEEIKGLSDDLVDWKNKLTESEKYFIKNILAFFASSDGIVNENLVINFYNEVQISEARQFYAVQIMMEAIHCVAPNTRILTDKGYFIIKDLKNKKVNVWNGNEFSNVTVLKTTDNSQLYKVILSNGMELECTEEHKWHMRVGNQKHPERCKNDIVYTKDLEIDDVIITQWSYPNLTIVDPDQFLNPYTHGFFCGDGYYNNDYPGLYLYDEKKKLLPFLKVSSNQEGNIVNDKISCQITGMINKEKYNVPINYSLITKLRWLEGFTDADGTSNLNPKKTCQSIQLSNTNKEFLKDIQLMLSTIGIDSNLKLNHEEEYRLLPTNSKDETRDKYEYYLCKKCYILYISCYNTVKLYNLGFKPNRVKLITIDQNIKQQKSLVKIVDIIKQNKYSETYCFNEPKNHTGIFNGILTGQSETYSLLIDTYIQDSKEKDHLFNAIETIPSVEQKAKWAMKWMDNKNASFAQRILAFVCVEGIFFSGSFCAIYWLKSRGLMPALATANEFISKDENLHAEFAIELYSMLDHKLTTEEVHLIFKEAVEIEEEFITKSLPVSLLGMNCNLMSVYIKFVADRWLTMLEYPKLFNVENPFGFMELISVSTKENFFEIASVSQYNRPGIGQTDDDRTIAFDEDF